MSLACCIGNNTGRRRRPEEGHQPEIECLVRCCVGAAGDAARCTPPRYKPLERAGSFEMPPKKPRTSHRRTFTTIGDLTVEGEPRLVRSGGMRRDWSFEDLGDKRES